MSYHAILYCLNALHVSIKIAFSTPATPLLFHCFILCVAIPAFHVLVSFKHYFDLLLFRSHRNDLPRQLLLPRWWLRQMASWSRVRHRRQRPQILQVSTPFFLHPALQQCALASNHSTVCCSNFTGSPPLINPIDLFERGTAASTHSDDITTRMHVTNEYDPACRVNPGLSGAPGHPLYFTGPPRGSSQWPSGTYNNTS